MQKKSIFITGAAMGIGRATAKLFAQQGWFVGAYDINVDGINSLIEELGGDNCMGGQLDVCDYSQYQQRLNEFTKANNGKLNVLFNNAGILEMTLFENSSLDTHHRTIDVNIKGVINGIYAALPLLKISEQACIISMGSASGVYGPPDHSVYAASKFAVRALTEALDIELDKYSIRVCDIMPAFVGTNMVLGQENASSLVEQMGIPHQAEDIAQTAWDMVHGKKLHSMTWQIRLFDFVTGLMPGLIRRAMKKAHQA